MQSVNGTSLLHSYLEPKHFGGENTMVQVYGYASLPRQGASLLHTLLKEWNLEIMMS
jgi:hypothetical protein